MGFLSLFICHELSRNLMLLLLIWNSPMASEASIKLRINTLLWRLDDDEIKFILVN